MPLYEYECDACGHRFEKIQKFSDPPLEACPSCGGAVRKLLSSPAIQFKGSGWYITDYAKKGASDKTSTDKSAPAGDSGDKAAKPASGSDSSPSTSAGSTSAPASKD